MEERFKVIHINSTTKDRYPTVDGHLNSEPIIDKGEIAVNGAEDGEFLAIVNTANKIKTFKDWDTTKNEIDKKSYVWDISVLMIGDTLSTQASFLKTPILKYLSGIPVFAFDGQHTLPVIITTDGNYWNIECLSINGITISHHYDCPYDVLNIDDDVEVEFNYSTNSDCEVVSWNGLQNYINNNIYTKLEIDRKILKIKEFTLEGTSGELPLSEWGDLVNSDLYICNGTYIYSHILNGNIINFDIVTSMASTTTLLTSTTIAFYSIENDGEKLIWSSRTYTGNLVEDVVDELGDGEHVVVSQKGISQQFNTTNNNITQLQNTVNTINNNYRKKVVSISSTETSKTIDANTYYKWGTMSSLTISLNTNVDSSILNEYIFEFASGSTPTTLSLPSSIKWLNGLTPIIQANKIYQVSIVNNLGVIAEFA